MCDRECIDSTLNLAAYPYYVAINVITPLVEVHNDSSVTAQERYQQGGAGVFRMHITALVSLASTTHHITAAVGQSHPLPKKMMMIYTRQCMSRCDRIRLAQSYSLDMLDHTSFMHVSLDRRHELQTASVLTEDMSCRQQREWP